MKISYHLVKTFLPGIKSKEQVIEALSLYAFEAEDAEGALIEVKLPPNRYSDAGSYIGIARELSAILNIKKIKQIELLQTKTTRALKKFSVRVENKDFCPRYCAQYFEGITVKESPAWLKEALIASGMRPINAIVDVMNYVMLETGQPMHAFDYDLLSPKKKPEIHIRSAKKGEEILSLDNIRYSLDPSIALIADKEKPLVIAGIKGGVGCEVSESTTKIIVEAANFNPFSIYRTTKKINLSTDASQRFAHELSRELPAYALSRAAFLLKQIAKAKVGERYDSLAGGISKKVLALDIERCNNLLGTNIKESVAGSCLSRLGFKNRKKNLWEVPELRVDIATPEDLAEEVARMIGYQNIPVKAPRASILPPEENANIVAKEKTRGILRALGFNEIYTHSFVSPETLSFGSIFPGEAVPVMNPTSAEFSFLRSSILSNVSREVDNNFRFFDELRMFEIGNVFAKSKKEEYSEATHVGIALAKKGSETFFELKGIVNYLLHGVGVREYSLTEINTKSETFFFEHALRIEANKHVLGFVGFNSSNISFAELNLSAILSVQEEEFGYEEIEKFPAVIRDISMFTDLDVRIGEVIEEIALSSKLVKDADLVDEYVDDAWANLQSITLRIVFQSNERTLTGEEVDKALSEIINELQKKFGVKMR